MNFPGKVQSPCKDCPDREPCCWSNCPKYQAFCAANNSRREAEKKAGRIEDDFIRSRQFKQVRLQKNLREGFNMNYKGMDKNMRCRGSGDQGAASATGDWGAASATGKSSVALASGLGGKVKGAIGCAIFLVERGDWDGDTYPIINVKAAIVDGETVKADTWYTLQNGDLVEVE